MIDQRRSASIWVQGTGAAMHHAMHATCPTSVIAWSIQQGQCDGSSLTLLFVSGINHECTAVCSWSMEPSTVNEVYWFCPYPAYVGALAKELAVLRSIVPLTIQPHLPISEGADSGLCLSAATDWHLALRTCSA